MGLSVERVRKKIYDCFLDILRIATAQNKNSLFIYEILDELVDDTPYHSEKFCSFVMAPITKVHILYRILTIQTHGSNSPLQVAQLRINVL